MSLLEMSLAGGALAAAITIIRALAINRLPKQTFLALWGVALLRLLVPVSLSSPLSLYALFSQPQAPAAVVRQTAAAPMPAAALPAPAVSEAPAPGPALDPWPLAWAAGVLAMALFFALSYAKWHGVFRTSLPASSEFAQNWLNRHPLRRPLRIRQSDRVAAPLTYGLLRPVILLPASMDWTDTKTLEYVFAHEYVHIRRFDCAGKLLLAGALCVHWFNPAVWAMYVLANRDMELSCDEAVVRQFGAKSRLEYVLALLAMEEQKSGLLHLNFSKNAMQERITAIMKLKKLTATAVLAACLVVAATTAAFATSAPEPAQAPSTPQQTAADPGPWNIYYSDGKLWFTAPADRLDIRICGRVEVEDFGGMSVHYEVPEPKKGETYSYDVSSGGYTELWLNEADLMGFLPPELKKVDYSIYEPFGLTYDQKLYFKGEKVRWFYDGAEIENGSAVRMEYFCDSGTVDVYTVWEPRDNGDGSYDPFGTLVDVRAYSQEEFDQRVIVKDSSTIESAYLFTPAGEAGKSFAEIFAPYTAYGITYVEAENASGAGDVYYNGELVGCFVDLSGTGVFSYQSRTKGGELNVRTVYDGQGVLTGVEQFTGPVELLEARASGDGLAWPLPGHTAISEAFQSRVHPITGQKSQHPGVDAAAPQGTAVLAAGDGTVLNTGFDSTYGNYVTLSHGSGLETFYAHLNSVSVSAGQAVARGQSIGTVGSTGQSTGPHLHLEVRADGAAQDPLRYFPNDQFSF